MLVLRVTVVDSLLHIISRKDSIIEAAATRASTVTTPAPQVTVNLPAEAWWNTPLVGGALAAIAGIASTLLVSAIARVMKRRRKVQALGTELAILQFRMVGSCLTLARRRGRLAPDLLNRLRGRVVEGPQTRDLRVLRTMIDHLLALPPEGLQAWQAPSLGPRRGLSLRRYDLPYLESGLAEIELLRPQTQGLVLHARGALDLFNQQVDEVWRYHWLTFERLEGQNHEVVTGNIERLHDHLLNAAVHVVNSVAVVLAQPDFERLRPLLAVVEELPADLEQEAATPRIEPNAQQ